VFPEVPSYQPKFTDQSYQAPPPTLPGIDEFVIGRLLVCPSNCWLSLSQEIPANVRLHIQSCSSSHCCKECKASSQVSLALAPWQRRICSASSGSPHWGQPSLSHFFQNFIHFLTPHIPTVNFETKRCLQQGKSLNADPIASQSTV